MRQGIVGEVGLFVGPFAPPGWRYCNGDDGTPRVAEPIPHVHPIICVSGLAPESQSDSAIVSEIRLFARLPTDRQWFECSGRTLAMSIYVILHSLIDNAFGGDKVKTFGLPKLASSVAGLRYAIAFSGAYPQYGGGPRDEPGGQMVGEIRLWAAERLPFGWRFCDGSALAVREYPAAFSVIGGKFGDEDWPPKPDSRFHLPTLPDPVPGVRYMICIQGTFPERP